MQQLYIVKREYSIEREICCLLSPKVLFSYDWLHAKLCATSLHDVLYDFAVVLKSTRHLSAVDRVEIGLVANALRVGGSDIGSCPDSLAFDLLGQLLAYYDRVPSISSSSSFRLSAIGDESPPCDSTSSNTSSSLSPEVISEDSTSGGVPDANPTTSLCSHGIDADVFDSSSTATDCAVDRLLAVKNSDAFGDVPDIRRVRLVQHNRVMRGVCCESGIRSLLQYCDSRSPPHSALLPILPCFEPPTAAALCALEGHSALVSDLAFLPATLSSAIGSNQSQGSVDYADDMDELVSVAADGTVSV